MTLSLIWKQIWRKESGFTVGVWHWVYYMCCWSDIVALQALVLNGILFKQSVQEGIDKGSSKSHKKKQYIDSLWKV